MAATARQLECHRATRWSLGCLTRRLQRLQRGPFARYEHASCTAARPQDVVTWCNPRWGGGRPFRRGADAMDAPNAPSIELKQGRALCSTAALIAH